MKLSTHLVAALVITASSLLHAQDPAPTGSVTGSADPGAQIVLTGPGDGPMFGIMATCDGTYKADNLKPGQYSIVEGGPHHAVRKVTVDAGATAHVDLGSATADSTRACNDKHKSH